MRRCVARWAMALGCALQLVTPELAPAAPDPVVYRPADLKTPEVASLLRSGQIVVSEQGSPMSLLFTLSAEDYGRFVHSGILVVDEDRIYVYEAMGKVRLMLTDNPFDSIKGKVRRTRLSDYIRRQKYVEIYEAPPGTDPDKLARFAREQYDNRTPFDAYFDNSDRGALYCTELLAAATEAAGGGPVRATPYRRNPSLIDVFDWLDVKAKSVYLAGSFTNPDRLVTAFSNGVTLRTARVHSAVNREIHRRFTADQKLGNVFRWDGGRLRFRSEIRYFRAQAFDLFPHASSPPSQADADAAVAALAERLFGPATVVANRDGGRGKVHGRYTTN